MIVLKKRRCQFEPESYLSRCGGFRGSKKLDTLVELEHQGNQNSKSKPHNKFSCIYNQKQDNDEILLSVGDLFSLQASKNLDSGAMNRFTDSSVPKTVIRKSNEKCKSHSGKNGNFGIGHKFVVDVKINKIVFSALVDTGATISAMNPEAVESLGEDLIRRIPVTGLMTQTAINGPKQFIKEMIEVRMEVACESQVWRFYLVEGLSTPIILGMDWMQASEIVLDVRSKTIIFGNKRSNVVEGDGC